MMDPPSKKKPRKCIDDATGDSTQQLRCDCCNKNLINEDIHIQNNPCNHSLCLSCVLKSNMNRVANPAYCQVTDCLDKYTTSCQIYNRSMPGEIIENGTLVELGIDEIAWILSFLRLEKIMCLRRVNMTWREAARKTIVPPSVFWVNCVERYNAMDVMTRAMPNLQQISIGHLGSGHKYNEGEDPDEEVAETANWTTHDIEIISNFSKLRDLTIAAGELLNGRYTVLFNSFPLLQKLSILRCRHLKWDLGMLVGMPVLKELDCENNSCLTGNISSLRVLKETLEKVHIKHCQNVEGNFMNLADFPHLKELNLLYTAVTGDIWDIGVNDFSSLEHLKLPHGVYGGVGYELQRISDGPELIRAVYLLKKRRPPFPISETWYATLSGDSPDRYESADEDDDTPPLDISFAIAASRFGYRWETTDSNPCEVNWLDPEPDSESSGYGKYIEELQQIEQVDKYRGFYQPPTEEEYHRVWEANVEEIDE